MLLYVLADTPTGRHVYRLGEHDDTGGPVVAALLDGIRKALKMPAELGDPLSPWALRVTVGGPHPDATAGAEFHDLTPDL